MLVTGTKEPVSAARLKYLTKRHESSRVWTALLADGSSADGENRVFCHENVKFGTLMLKDFRINFKFSIHPSDRP